MASRGVSQRPAGDRAADASDPDDPDRLRGRAVLAALKGLKRSGASTTLAHARAAEATQLDRAAATASAPGRKAHRARRVGARPPYRPRHIAGISDGAVLLPSRENALRQFGVGVGKAALHPRPRVVAEAGVGRRPGSTMRTRRPKGSSSSASDWVKAFTAAFDKRGSERSDTLTTTAAQCVASGAAPPVSL